MINFKTLPLKPEQILLPAVVLLIACLAYLFDDSLNDYFIYQRDYVSNGELWRTFTSHFFHTNGYHLLLNSCAVILLWALHGHFYNLKNYTLIFIISAISTSFGIHYFSLTIDQYVGLSGILHGVFVWGAIMDIKFKDKTGYLLFIGVWVKVLHEQFYGANEDVAQLISAHVAIDAHLWGAIGGLIMGVWILVSPKNSVIT